MKYLLLLYVDPERAPQPASPEGEADMGRWWAITDELDKAGVNLAGEALQPTTTATTVRANGGEPVLSDGPFAETKELLGGFYMIEVPDLDEATKWAAKMPNAAYGSVEVRAVQEFERA